MFGPSIWQFAAKAAKDFPSNQGDKKRMKHQKEEIESHPV